MTNTINVPRELLERVLDYDGAVAIRQNARHELRALLSAPSPAGGDGLGVVALWYADDDLGRAVDYVKIADGEGLCRLTDAQAIIDGLRGEVAKINSDRLACWAEFKVMTRACLDAEKERDQHAQRIGELEGLLRHAQKQVPTGSGLHMRIDAALSAVCAAAPNIAPTSEHSGS